MHAVRTRPASVVLGVETSCDDTSVGIVAFDPHRRAPGGGTVAADVVASQFSLHAPHRGVVPMLASRAHADNLPVVLERAIADGVASGVLPKGRESIDAVAVTAGPGLALCLRVGFEAARDLAASLRVPFIGINHLEAHALVPRLVDEDVRFPFLVLLVSGGHSMLLLARGVGDYVRVGTTLDDALGEAFDKVARIIHAGHHTRAASESEGADGAELAPDAVVGHSGAALEALAREGDPRAYPFPVPMRRGSSDCNFSFSGLKTAVLFAVQRGPLEVRDRRVACDIAASFQYAATQHVLDRVARALRWCEHEASMAALRSLAPSDGVEASKTGESPADGDGGEPGAALAGVPSTVVVCGGVAANQYLRTALTELGEAVGVRVAFPAPRLCTDNGLMVAWAAAERLRAEVARASAALAGDERDTGSDCDSDCDADRDVREAGAVAAALAAIADDPATADFSPRWPLGDPRPPPSPQAMARAPR